MVSRCGSDRPSRSNFQTTRQSPARMKASAFARPARSSRLPLARSSNRCRSSTPAASKASRCRSSTCRSPVGRDAHVADQHVRKTSPEGFPHSASFRQGLSCSFWPTNRRLPSRAVIPTENRCFPTPTPSVTQRLVRAFLAGFPRQTGFSVLSLSAYAYQEASSLVLAFWWLVMANLVGTGRAGEEPSPP